MVNLLTISVFRQSRHVFDTRKFPSLDSDDSVDEAIGHPLAQLVEWDEFVTFLDDG